LCFGFIPNESSCREGRQGRYHVRSCMEHVLEFYYGSRSGNIIKIYEDTSGTHSLGFGVVILRPFLLLPLLLQESVDTSNHDSMHRMTIQQSLLSARRATL